MGVAGGGSEGGGVEGVRYMVMVIDHFNQPAC